MASIWPPAATDRQDCVGLRNGPACLPAVASMCRICVTVSLNRPLYGPSAWKVPLFYIEPSTCKKQVFDQQFSENLDSADFGKLVLHIVIDKAVMRQRAAASLLGA